MCMLFFLYCKLVCIAKFYLIIVDCRFQDANCGNTLLISLEELVKDGLLKKEELPKAV